MTVEQREQPSNSVVRTNVGTAGAGRVWLPVLLALLWLLSGCAVSMPDRLWLNAPGWDRGLNVGTTAAVDPVPIVLDGDAQIVLFMLESAGQTARPRVLALNRAAETVWETRLDDTVVSRPDKPGLILHNDRLHLFWLSSQRLHTAVLDSAGNVVEQPRLLSGETIVESYDVFAFPDGRLGVWYAGSRQSPGLYALDLDAEAAVLLDPQGMRPTVRVDAQGGLHAVWLHYPPGFDPPEFLYAYYPDGQPLPGQETAFLSPALSPTSVLEGPRMGLDSTRVYTFWTISIRTGPEAGAVDTFYVHFPYGAPDALQRASLVGAALPDLPYAPAPDGVFQAGPRVDLSDQPLSPDTMDVATVSTAVDELAIAFTNPVQHQFRKIARQTATLFLRDGDVAGYQLLSYTVPASDVPFIAADDNLYLYVTWVERSDTGGFVVYFASSAPDVRAALGRVTRQDVSQMLSETVFGMLAGLVLTPFVIFLWSVGGFVVYFLTGFLRRNENAVGTAVSLALTMAGYWAVKLLSLPGLRSYVPFSAWIPRIPAWMQAPLQIGVPLAITLFAIWVAWHTIFRRGSRSPLYFFLTFAAVDGALTMAVYGFLIYNTI